MNLKEKTDTKAPNPRAHWPEALQREFEDNAFNGCVGTVLVSEADEMRIWHLHLPPGKRCNFHRHVNNYFWSAHTAGKARGYYGDGRIVDVTHHKGETRHFKFGAGEYFIHSVENIGDADLLFTTVEFLTGPNVPLPLPESVRLKHPT